MQDNDILHGDIKPQNILINTLNLAVITDFGNIYFQIINF